MRTQKLTGRPLLPKLATTAGGLPEESLEHGTVGQTVEAIRRAAGPGLSYFRRGRSTLDRLPLRKSPRLVPRGGEDFDVAIITAHTR